MSNLAIPIEIPAYYLLLIPFWANWSIYYSIFWSTFTLSGFTLGNDLLLAYSLSLDVNGTVWNFSENNKAPSKATANKDSNINYFYITILFYLKIFAI